MVVHIASVRMFHDIHAGVATDSPLAVITDIDSLLWLNDQLGEHAGDQALLAVARAVSEATASIGTAEIFRVAGDSFLAILPGTTLADALQVAASIVERVRALNLPYRRLDHPERTTVEVNAAVIRVTPQFLENLGQYGLTLECQHWLSAQFYAKKVATGSVGVVVDASSATTTTLPLPTQLP
jgi:diguanylate cyclase (GGDEF)-like protein